MHKNKSNCNFIRNSYEMSLQVHRRNEVSERANVEFSLKSLNVQVTIFIIGVHTEIELLTNILDESRLCGEAIVEVREWQL